MKSQILFISTYPELTTMALDVSKKLGVSLVTKEGGIMKGGHLYAKMMENKFDVIVSQGGTAAAIKSMVNIPVIEIETSIADMLNALLKAKEYSTKIGLVCYQTDNLDDLESLKNVLDIDFEIFPYSNKDGLIKQVEDAISVGKLTLVGMGNCIIDNDKQKQLNTLIIKSSRRAVEQAIISAKNIIDLGRREKERGERLRAIIDYSREGIIAFDKDGIVTTINPVGEKILELNRDHVIGNKLFEFMKRENIESIYEGKSQQIGKLVKINNIQIILNRIPIIVDNEQTGMVITFQEVSKFQKLEQKVRTQLYTKGLIAKYNFNDIIGESIAIQDTINKAKRFGRTSSTILINGETGSGKELFAQSIHNISHKRDGPFVAINCAALPDNLLESELFGYEDGAFTGAKKGGKPGLFELAHKGTIFLDEIGEIPLSVQSRLLRVLQEKEVLRIGGDYIINVDIRVVAATNLNLYEMVQDGKFREDLYFRLNILNLRIPPLRERKEDIPLLVKNLINIKSLEHDNNVKEILEPGMNLLKEYNWTGNVRELENFIEKMIILSDTSIVDEKNIEQLLLEHIPKKPRNLVTDENSRNTIKVQIGKLKDMELQLIEAMSKIVEGDKSLLSEKLGISRTTLWKKLKELEIN